MKYVMIVCLAIFLVQFTYATEITAEPQWEQGSRQLIEIKGISGTAKVRILDGSGLVLDTYNPIGRNGYASIDYQVPYNYEEGIITIEVDGSEYKDVLITKMPFYKKFFHWIWGNLFGVF